MAGKNIYHIFPSHMTHLSPQLISSFHKLFPKFNQLFIVYGGESERAFYNPMSEIISDILFISNTKELNKILFKDSHILLHSLIPDICKYTFLNRFKNVSVVCWGSGIKIVSLKNYLLYPLKFILYHSFKRMITLMEPDKNYLQDKYLIRNIINQPYIGEREFVLHKYMDEKVASVKKDTLRTVYVGNNSSCINSYSRIAKNRLVKFKKSIDLQFMLHYDYSPDDLEIIKLKEICDNNYTSYSFNTDLYNLEEYVRYLDKCDIYICDEERQTGLAAIYSLLCLGKKLYLNGNNYNWVTSLGCSVHHTSELSYISVEEFLKGDTNSVIKNNHDIIMNLENLDSKVIAWNNILNLI